MKTAILGFLAAILLVTLVSQFKDSPAKLDTPSQAHSFLAPTPVYEWREVLNETASMPPSGDKWWQWPEIEGRFKVEASAQYPVDAGFWLDDPDTENIACASRSVMHSQQTCDITRGEGVFIVRDMRQEQGAVAQTAIGMFTRNAAMVNRAIEPNAVTIRILRWDCIRNCPSSR